MAADHETIRTRTVHGWAFTDLPAETVVRIKAYLQDGNPEHLQTTQYVELRQGVLGRLTATERKRFGLSAKQREKKPKLTPPPGAPQTMGEAAQHVSAALTRDDMKLVVAISKDGVALMDVNCPPEEAIQLLHALMHSLQDKLDKPDPTLN